MHELLFRGERVDNGVWKYGGELFICDDGKYYISDNGVDFFTEQTTGPK